MFSVSDLKGRIRWLYKSSMLRLTLLLSVIFALGMAISIFLALSLGRDAILRRVDDTLAGIAATVEVDDMSDGDYAVLVRPVSLLGGLPGRFQRAAARGGGTVNLETDFRGAETWRMLVTRDSEGVPIVIAVPLDNSEDALELLGNSLWTVSAVVLFCLLGIGLGAGYLAQRRLARITGTLGRLGAGDLQARTGIDRSSDDLDELARQLDRTAGELERLVAQTRHLSASLAHDLRTPLARLRARLEVLPEGEQRSAALEEAERLSGIFDTIMRIARIEAAHGTDGFEPVDLGSLLTEIADIFGPVVEDRGKDLLQVADRPRTVLADRKMLIQGVANLIQNAVVHGGSQITLFATANEIGVADNGAGVPPGQFEEITKPMVRLDAARESDGTGLGLALVRAVADRHGADLVLSEETPSGLRVALRFTNL